jgi:hypothetical protein
MAESADVAILQEKIHLLESRDAETRENVRRLEAELARLKEQMNSKGTSAQTVAAQPQVPVRREKEFAPSSELLKWDNKKDWWECPLDGIIAHLTQECVNALTHSFPFLHSLRVPRSIAEVQERERAEECGGMWRRGNVHELGVVVVTSSGRCGGSESDEKNVVDLQEPSWFGSDCRGKQEEIAHTRNNWLCYDFKDRRIIPSHYSIRTHGEEANGQHLRNWVVEVSDCGEKWSEIDGRENNSDLNGEYFTATFEVKKTCECRMIRLVNVGRNWHGDDALYISAWEIFGILIE